MNERTPRVAIVTGSARNIGASIAKKLAADHISVVINALKDKEAALNVAKDITSNGGCATTIMADVTDENAVNNMVTKTIEKFGRVDILVSNASIRGQTPITKMSLNEWHNVLAVPLDGAFLCSRAVIPHMKQTGSGRIITLGGISAYIGTAERCAIH